jgi:oligopeptide transport system substrate-binding protein
MRSLPPEKLAEAKTEFGDRLIQEASSSFTYVGLPLGIPALKEKKIRQALSMAIDRKAIIKNIFDDRFIPAKSVVSPVVPGSRDDACKYCDYDPAKAKALLAEAGGWKGGKIQFWFNAGAGHEKWMQVVGDQLKANLGIDYELKGNLQFAEYLGLADEKKFTGPFRLGWQMDYPLAENYLKPLYGTQGSSNNTGYTNAEVDKLITQGDEAKSLEEAIKFYQQAEDLVLEDLPVIPMWFGQSSMAYSEKVGNVTYDVVNANPDFEALTVK